MTTSSRIEVIENFKDKWWRLNNLYYIQDEDGRKVKFVPNQLQAKFYWDMWFLNILLKARQFGGTTFVGVYFLDDCLWTTNIEAAIIAHKAEDAEKIFKRKVHFPYFNLPQGLRDRIYLNKERSDGLEWCNGSSMFVTNSVRSGTVQRLLISEHGKICLRFPDKAEEIRTGSLNAIHQGNIVVIESTAEGRHGDFYAYCRQAEEMQKSGKHLTKLDFKFHFFPWFWDRKNQLSPKDAATVTIPADMQVYFDELETKGIVTEPDGNRARLTLEQKTWYVKKKEKMRDKMTQEFPSTSEEAFQASVRGAFYTQEMIAMRKDNRICRVPYAPNLPVNTAWDLGLHGHLAIVFHQAHLLENRLIDFFTNAPADDEDPENLEDKGFPLYAKMLLTRGYTYGTHYLPHDVAVESMSTGKTRLSTLQSLLPGHRFVVVDKWDLADGIQAVHNFLPTCWIDEKKCEPLVSALDAYQREPDYRNGGFKSTPLGNWASHPADAVRYLAIGHTYKPVKSRRRNRRRNAMVV